MPWFFSEKNERDEWSVKGWMSFRFENMTAFGFFKAYKSVSAMVDFSLVLVAFRKTAVLAPSSVCASRD